MKARDYIRLQCITTGLSSITLPYFFRVLHTEGLTSILKNSSSNSQELHHQLLHILVSFRNKTSTDPRDKVYGILGLTTARDDPRFTVDYSCTVSEVYRKVAEYVITVTHNLEIISVRQGIVHPDSLPS
jgi:hypothetical protein